MIKKAERLQHVKEYYFSRKLREVRALVAKGKPVINMAIGSPDLKPSAPVVKALEFALEVPVAHKYQSYQGVPELREAIQNFYQKHYNVDLNPENEILPLMGSKEGIMHISMAFLNPGDEVLIPNPGYPTYASVTNLLQAVPKMYNLTADGNWLPDLKTLEEQDLSKVKIMWLNYPHMPTGAKATLENFKELVDFAKRNNILLVNDNPYSFILNDEPLSILQVEGAKEVALELNSLSKTFNMAGWRVGMVLGQPELIKAVLEVKSNMDSGMFFGIQQGAIRALKSKQAWFDHQNAIYSKRRKLVWKIFEELNCKLDKEIGGMFVWAKLPEGKNAEEVSDFLLYEKDVFITPGSIFGSNGNGYLRASLCISEAELEEVLKRLKN